MILRMLLLHNRSELSISYLVLFFVHYNIVSEATVGWKLIGMTIYHFLKNKGMLDTYAHLSHCGPG